MNRNLVALSLGLVLTLAPSTGANAQHEDQAPGGELHEQTKRNLAARAGHTRAVPPVASCTLSTPDFVVTGSETSAANTEHCFPSNGAGVFAPRSNIPGTAIVDGMDVADMDNDGDNDFLACDGLVGEVYLYTQGPANVFTPSLVASGITTGVSGSLFCTYLREADFNGDNLKDFVVGDNRVTNGTSVYLQGPVGTFTPVATGLNVNWASPSGIPCNCLFGIGAGDVNGDGNDDILMLGYRGAGTGQVWYYQGNGTGAMAAPVLKFNVSATFPVVANPTGLALFDLEGDGDLDVVVGGSFDGSHYVYTNDGLGNFTAPAASVFTVNNWSGIDAYDVNGDSQEDVMLVDWSNRRLLYSQNLGVSLGAPAAVGVVDGASIGIGAPARAAKPDPELDHFKCYRSQSDNPGNIPPVLLTDQFGHSEAQVLKSSRFCTPVQKEHNGVITPIKDRDAHLEFYDIAVADTPPLVEVGNQFGPKQRLEVGHALYLVVPTQKIQPGNHPFPQNLDHFKCYEAFGEPVSIPVGLRDQFGEEPQVKVVDPQLLCNPTEKIHNNIETPILNPLDHLVCYRIENTIPLINGAFVRNQFGQESLHLDIADLLCLPSTKKVIQ